MLFYSPLQFQPFFFIASMKPRSPLRRLLQEQQEPFELEDYLFERDYSIKSLDRGGGFACSGGRLDSIKKVGKGFVEINKKLRNSCKRLVSINRKQKTKDLGNNGGTSNVGCKRVAESEKFSSPYSPPKMFGSFSGNDHEEMSSSTRQRRTNSSTSDTFRVPEPCNLQVVKAKQAAAGKKLVTRSMEPRKQGLIQARPKDNRLRNGIPLKKKVTEDSILSATLWELLLYSASTEKTSSIGTAELQELVTSNPASQLLISKRVIHQTKQLLFDCVREVVEAHSKRGRHLGSEEARRLICEKEATGEKANLLNLLNSDFLDSVAEWRDLKPQKLLIGTEIGEIILKEIINETVTQLIDNMPLY